MSRGLPKAPAAQRALKSNEDRISISLTFGVVFHRSTVNNFPGKFDIDDDWVSKRQLSDIGNDGRSEV